VHYRGLRVRASWLHAHIIRALARHPSLLRSFMRMRTQSPLIRSMQIKLASFIQHQGKLMMHKMLSAMASHGARNTMFNVRADRAIVNVGHGNKFSPTFYKSQGMPNTMYSLAKPTTTD